MCAHPERFSADFYPSMIRLAERLTPDYPAAAWHLYRSLAADILGKARARAYPHAAKYLRQMRGLAAPAGLGPDHEAWEAALRDKHGRKRSFWKHLPD